MIDFTSGDRIWSDFWYPDMGGAQAAITGFNLGLGYNDLDRTVAEFGSLMFECWPRQNAFSTEEFLRLFHEGLKAEGINANFYVYDGESVVKIEPDPSKRN
jgi:hypothetical protein